MSARECDRHREALAELAERDDATPAGTLALDHVARCPACAEVLGDLTLTVVALRRVAVLREWPPRAAVAPGQLEHALDTTWSRLRDRIDQSRRAAREQAWRWRMSLGGVLASALVVGALVGPATVGFGPASVDPVAGDPEVLSWQIEVDYVSGAHAVPINADAAGPTGSIGFRRYPDDLRPVKKEVAPARSSGLAPDAR